MFQEYNKKYLYVKPQLGLLYPGADYVSETIKKRYNANEKLHIVVDCINIMKLDYSAAKVSIYLTSMSEYNVVVNSPLLFNRHNYSSIRFSVFYPPSVGNKELFIYHWYILRIALALVQNLEGLQFYYSFLIRLLIW